MSMASSRAPSAAQSRHTQVLMQFNEDMFKRNVLTDVECVVEGQSFKAHRALLVCFSPYLKKKLLKPDGKPSTDKIHIPKIGQNEFEILLRYMYTGSLQVDCNSFFDVYKAASLLEMKDAKLECLQMIDGRDEIRTYFYTYVLSKKLGVQQNWQRALKLITHRFEETAFSKEFMQLNLNYVLEILSAQSIGARSETIVFLAALNWLNYDFGSREFHTARVMECVRFSSLTMAEIVACYHPPFLPQVVQIPEIVTMLFKATCYIAAKSQGQETWFKQYASPKRNLTMESLPLELWNKRSPPPSPATVAPPWADSSQADNVAVERWITAPKLAECLRGAAGIVPSKADLESTQMKKKLSYESKIYPDSMQAGKAGSSDVAGSKRSELDSQGQALSAKNIPTFETGTEYRSLSEIKGFDEETEADDESSLHEAFSDTKIDSRGLKRGKVHPTSFKGEKSRARNSFTSRNLSSAGPDEVQYIAPNHTKIKNLRQQIQNRVPNTKKEDLSKRRGEEMRNRFFGKFVDKEKVSEERIKTAEVEDLPFPSTENSNEEQANIIILPPTKHPHKDAVVKTKAETSPSIISSLSSEMSKSDDSKQSKVKAKDDAIQPKVKSSFIKSAVSRKSKEEDGSIYIIGGMNPKNITKGAGTTVSVFNLEENKWVLFSKIPEPRHNHTSAYLDNFLYVVGGCNLRETIETNRYIAKRSCFKMDFRSKIWSTLPDMLYSRYDHSAVVYGGRLYVIGGQDENERLLNSVEVFEPRKNRWTLLQWNMCCGRKAMGVAIYANRIWVAGGLIQYKSDGYLRAVSHVDCFHLGEKRWRFNMYSLPGPRCFCSLVVWNEKLFCIGGMVRTDDGKTQPTDEVWFVGNENDLWTRGPSLPEPRMGGVAMTCGDNLYFLGGFNPSCDSGVSNVVILKPNSTSWDDGPPLSSHLFGLSAVVSARKQN